MVKNHKNKLGKVENLVKHYTENLTQADIDAYAALYRNPDLKKSNAYPALNTILNRHLDDAKLGIKYPNEYKYTPSGSDIAFGATALGYVPNMVGKIKTMASKAKKVPHKNIVNYAALDASPELAPNVVNYAALDAAPELAPNIVNTADKTAKAANASSSLGSLGTLGTHAAAFAAGYGTKGLKDRFDRRVRKKGLDSDTNITGGLFNFGKKQNREISYLNKRLNKNILSKFMSFDSMDNRVINYDNPILQKDPELKNMIQDLVSDARNEGKYFTSKRDIAKLRMKINKVERYMLNKHPNLFYGNGNNGETTDLLSYINANRKVPMDYIPDMNAALNQERSSVEKELEPSKWRKRLQKWLA